jgi:hypothetical protein
MDLTFPYPYGLYLNHPTQKRRVWGGGGGGCGDWGGGENPIRNNDNVIPASFPKLIKTGSTNHKCRINFKPISSE